PNVQAHAVHLPAVPRTTPVVTCASVLRCTTDQCVEHSGIYRSCWSNLRRVEAEGQRTSRLVITQWHARNGCVPIVRLANGPCHVPTGRSVTMHAKRTDLQRAEERLQVVLLLIRQAH